MIATAPGKLILTGEYAVLDGGPALVVAVDRRVVARCLPPRAPHGSSPFLLAVARQLAARLGGDHPAARAALEIAVDSSAFYDGAQKLGLGSSAAVTVAATALALALGSRSHDAASARAPGSPSDTTAGAPARTAQIDRELVLGIALAAHADAQGARGARGSGADIAAAVYGGTLVYALGGAPASEPFARPMVQRRRWPASVALIPFFTGVSADTASLVARVEAARVANRDAVEAALAAIAAASRAACDALNAPEELAATALIGAFRIGAQAIDRLAIASGVDLVPACVGSARKAMHALGGTAKTTGAGGGDIGVVVIPATADRSLARSLLIEAGCSPLQLSVDETGVDTRPEPK